MSLAMNTPMPKFDFYQEVLVISAAPEKSGQIGGIGVILGRTETEDQRSWYYAVQFGDDDSWCFFERELEATGRTFSKEDFFDGSTVRVRVDDCGRGEIVE